MLWDYSAEKFAIPPFTRGACGVPIADDVVIDPTHCYSNLRPAR